jgi:Alpha/beta hydrolase domain
MNSLQLIPTVAAILLLHGCANVEAPRPADGVIRSAKVGDCASVIASLDASISNVRCTVSPDLTTTNPDTTPPDNSISDLPVGAYIPRADRAAIGAGAAGRAPITKLVPGLQITGTMSGDDQTRFVVRLPNAWNGRLVMAASAGTRSEYAGDWAHSDELVQRGYAYVSTNKGIFNSRPGSADDAKSCYLSAPGPSAQLLRLYLSDSTDNVAKWFGRTRDGTAAAKKLAAANYGSGPAYTYLVGISAGGWVVRRLLEVAPEGFDGGIDWESPPVSARVDNGILAQFPVALANFRDYEASGFSTSSDGYKTLQALGYPPELTAPNPNPLSPRGSYLETYKSMWGVLECGFVGALDPSYSSSPPPPATYAGYDYRVRQGIAGLAERMTAIGFDGHLKRPMISLHGTLDALALVSSARDYHRSVVDSGVGRLHRLYEIQNGSHHDRNRDAPWNFAQIERITPYFAPAFEQLAAWVERGVAPPAGQCVPRGGAIVQDPRNEGRPETCLALLAGAGD